MKLLFPPFLEACEVVDLQNSGTLVPFGVEEDGVHLFKEEVVEDDEVGLCVGWGEGRTYFFGVYKHSLDGYIVNILSIVEVGGVWREKAYFVT